MKTLLIILISVLTYSCATKKQTRKETAYFNEITFGSGGGFTGQGNQYLIKNDGGVYKNINDSLILLNQINAQYLDSISNQLAEMKFDTIKFLENGNITYHIEVLTHKYENKVTWSDQSQAENLKQLYKTLVKTFKKQ